MHTPIYEFSLAIQEKKLIVELRYAEKDNETFYINTNKRVKSNAIPCKSCHVAV